MNILGIHITNTFLTLLLVVICSHLYSQNYWEELNSPPGVKIQSIALDTSNSILIGLSATTGGGVHLSLDTGVSWEYIGLEHNIYDLHVNNLNYFYAASGWVFISQNNGASWDTISEQYNPTTIFVKDSLIIIGGYGGLHKSIDHGASWFEVLSISPSSEVIKSVVYNETTSELFAGSTNFSTNGGGGIYRSVDLGDTWTHFGLSDHYISSLAINSDGDLFAGTRGHTYNYSGGVFVLRLGTNQWDTLNSSELVNSMVINTQDIIFIACSDLDWYVGGVRKSKDNGLTWEILNDGLGEQEINNLEIGIDGHLYASGPSTPLFRSISSTITSIKRDNKQQTSYCYNYPNPFFNQTTIHFLLFNNHTNQVLISIIDASGNTVKQLLHHRIPGNKQSIKINASNMSPGIYYYSIRSGNDVITNRMVLVQ